MPVTYDEYSFTTDPDPELRELIQECNHIINDAQPLPDVMGTWTLEKPAGVIELLPPGEKQHRTVGIPPEFEKDDYPSAEEIGAFIYRFEQWFYYIFDGYNLFFSRFPTLPPMLSYAKINSNPAVLGILLGYSSADVAEYTIESEGEFKVEKGWDL